MNLYRLAQQSGQNLACWDNPHLYSDPALDYEPNHKEFRHLTDDEKAEHAEAKAKAEQAAVDNCYNCPFMMQCEQADDANIQNRNQRAFQVVGVVAGRTQHEREVRHGLSNAAPVADLGATPSEADYVPGDRGPRNKIDHREVARLTALGRTSTQIADTLGCSARSVTRARVRLGIATRSGATPVIEVEIPTQAQESATQATVQSVDDAVNITGEFDVDTTGLTPVTGTPFLAGRVLSPEVEAVFNHLAAQPSGTDTWENMIAGALGYVSPDDAINWWLKKNSRMVNGERVMSAAMQAVTLPERVKSGAEAKLYNAIDALVRRGKYLTRSADRTTYTFMSESRTRWTARTMGGATVETPYDLSLVSA